MNTSDVLNKAADLIEERGWGHGSMSMLGREGVCLMGAIHAATFDHFDEDYLAAVTCDAGRAIYGYLELQAGNVDAGWEWNDDKWRIKDGAWSTERPNEVVEVLRATAVIEAARESETARESEAAQVSA